MDELRLVFLNQRLNRFDFDYEIFIDAQISKIVTDDLSVIADLDRLLLSHANAGLLQFDAQCVLIYFFEKARTEGFMNFVCVSDDLVCESVVCHPESPLVQEII